MVKKKYWIYIQIVITVLPILACGVFSEMEEPQPTYTPLPTYTPYPTFAPNVTTTPDVTPAPDFTPTLEGPIVLYENDFTDPNNTLEIVELERYQTSQENGAYYVEHLSGGPTYIALPVTAYNFIFDVDVSVLKGPDDGATFGLGFRGREGYSGEYYRWRISTNGNFHIHANTNDNILPLEWFERDYDVAGDWFKSSAINQGYGVTNHLRIVANGDEISFFINNQMVMQARDSRLQNNYFALITHADGYSETTFDNLMITELDEKILNEFQFPTITPIPALVSEHILFEDNFDNGNLDAWIIKSGSWNVVDGQLLCISSHDARIIAGDESWEDYSISADIKPISGSVDVGIYGRLLDTTHTYQGQLWNEKARIKIWDDDWSDLATESFLSTNDTWYNLRLEIRDNEIKLYINGDLATIVEDTVYQKGKIGLRCASTSQAYFDNVKVTLLP